MKSEGFKGRAGLVFLLALGLAGCELFQEAPRVVPQPPRIFALSLTPESVPAGTSAVVHMSFRYEDPNADVGPQEAEVEVQTEALSGNMEVAQPLVRVRGRVLMDEHFAGRSGSVALTHTLEVPPAAYGVLRLSVALFDRAGGRSNALSGEIAVGVGTGTGGRGGPEACAFLDGDGRPVTAYRIGRQVFFRVADPDNDTSQDTQDLLYGAASVQAGATGDREPIPVMVETGPDTGVFEGPVGGFLLVSRPSEPGDGRLFAWDGDTLIATYQDPNDPGDVCIALAKLR